MANQWIDTLNGRFSSLPEGVKTAIGTSEFINSSYLATPTVEKVLDDSKSYIAFYEVSYGYIFKASNVEKAVNGYGPSLTFKLNPTFGLVEMRYNFRPIKAVESKERYNTYFINRDITAGLQKLDSNGNIVALEKNDLPIGILASNLIYQSDSGSDYVLPYHIGVTGVVGDILSAEKERDTVGNGLLLAAKGVDRVPFIDFKLTLDDLESKYISNNRKESKALENYGRIYKEMLEKNPDLTPWEIDDDIQVKYYNSDWIWIKDKREIVTGFDYHFERYFNVGDLFFLRYPLELENNKKFNEEFLILEDKDSTIPDIHSDGTATLTFYFKLPNSLVEGEVSGTLISLNGMVDYKIFQASKSSEFKILLDESKSTKADKFDFLGKVKKGFGKYLLIEVLLPIGNIEGNIFPKDSKLSFRQEKNMFLKESIYLHYVQKQGLVNPNNSSEYRYQFLIQRAVELYRDLDKYSKIKKPRSIEK